MAGVHAKRQVEREDRFFRWVLLYGSPESFRRVKDLSIDSLELGVANWRVTDERRTLSQLQRQFYNHRGCTIFFRCTIVQIVKIFISRYNASYKPCLITGPPISMREYGLWKRDVKHFLLPR
jgi:hypothetical protein